MAVSVQLAVALFLLGLLTALSGSEALVRGLLRLGLLLRLAAGLLGLLTALGADAPEISSAFTALVSGSHEVGIGVILGSNAFNLAALLGVPALLGPRLEFSRPVPLVNGGVSLLVTVIAAALLLGWLPSPLAVSLLGLVFAAYVVVLAAHPSRLRRLPVSSALKRPLVLLSMELHPQRLNEESLPGRPAWGPVWLMVPAVAAIVVGSFVMVSAALALGQRWAVPGSIVGAVALAATTSLPNAYAAIRLAFRREGATLISEAFNSNTLNLLFGLGLPAVVLTDIGQHSPRPLAMIAWLIGFSVLAMALPAAQRALSRPAGVALLLAYLGFLALAVR